MKIFKERALLHGDARQILQSKGKVVRKNKRMRNLLIKRLIKNNFVEK